MSFPRYPEYKDSGVEWLGEVPAHWQLMPLVRFTEAKCDGPFGSGIKSDHYTDEGALVVRLQNIRAEGFFVGESVFIDLGYFEQELLRHEVCAGDVLIAGLGDDNNVVGRACVAPAGLGPALVKADCFRFRIDNHKAKPEFVATQLTAGARFDAGRLSGGSTRSRIPLGTMASRQVCLPPTHEQAQIATFLDRETAKIDALVEEQQRLIELLKEKRQAVISQAVTKGLDPNVPMKDSGVEWLGQVPAHWEVRKVNSLSTKITNGYVGPTRDILVDEGVRYLQSLHIKGNRIRFDDPYFVTREWSERHAKSILEAGDLLIVQTGDIGQAAVVTDAFAGCNCHALIIVAPIRELAAGEYLGWVFNSDYGISSLLAIQTGALHPHLNCGNVKDIFVPLPPMHEQLSIVQHCAQKTAAFDELTSAAQSAVALLQERRAALISAAVTGKIDVRGLAA
jgi:type I restriction enzyme S subunit